MSDKIKLVSGKEVELNDVVYWVDKRILTIESIRMSVPLDTLVEEEHVSQVFATIREAEIWLDRYKNMLIIEETRKSDFEDFDSVNKPKHYQSKSGQDALDVIEDFGLDFYYGNSWKYIARAGKKDPNKEIEDVQKAVEYLQRKLKVLNAKTNSNSI